MTKTDWLGIAFLIAVIIFASYVAYYRPNPSCEVARPAYKCATALEVMREHCEYWANYSCNTSAQTSLEQVEWYIKNLCDIHNRYHENKLDCTNLARACNQVLDGQACG